MAQIFAPRSTALFRFAIMLLTVGAVGAFFTAETVSRAHYVTGKDMVATQPVPFSHKHHVGEVGINCLFCHTSVLVSSTAGMPSTGTCMHCHSQLWTHAPMLEPVRHSWATGTPLRWTRVFWLPEYVYFNDSIHIAKGVGCSSCHGRMDRMNLTREAHVFTMDFCINCHTNPAAHLRPQNQIWNMEWQPPADQDKLGPALAAMYHINTSGHLTDCSTCHR